MADTCAEPHPDRSDISCDKPQPCYGYHANAEHDLIWGARDLPGKRVKASRIQQIVAEVAPAERTGPPLATRAHARHTDPHTSHEAAASLTNLRPAQMEVLGFFTGQGPMTDERLLEVADLARSRQTPSGLRTRRSELVDAGHLEDSGERRQTVTGHQAIVWRLKT